MAQLSVERKSRQGLLTWAIIIGLILLGVVVYLGLEAIAPPPDPVDPSLVQLVESILPVETAYRA